MNERIRELAVEAGAIEAKDITNIPRALSLNGEEIGKFAELIVAECLVTLDSIVCDTSGERDTLWVARKVVSDHFGVDGMSTEDKKTLIKELLGVKND